MNVLSDAEIAVLAEKPLDDLSDDELALVAERALKKESERRSAQYDREQQHALQHLRAVVSDILNTHAMQASDAGAD